MIVLLLECINTSIYAKTNVCLFKSEKGLYNIQSKSSSSFLYLITDKTLYTPGEVIWFAGYLISAGKTTDTLQPDIVSVALLQQGDTAYTIRKDYFIHNGLCAGSLTLPDSIAAGTYELIAAADILDSSGKPAYVFRKQITIKTTEPPPFNTNFSITDSPKGDSLYIKLQAYNYTINKIAASTKHDRLEYHLMGETVKTAKLSDIGRATIAIAKTEVSNNSYVLYTRTFWNGNTTSFNLLLPHTPDDSVVSQSTPALPKQKGMSLTTNNAIADNEITMQARTNKPASVRLAIGNTDGSIRTLTGYINIDSTKKIKFLLDSIDKGIHTLLLLDSNNNTIAQRAFFTHYNSDSNVHIIIDKPQYKTREKVNLSVSLQDNQGNDLPGIFTVYCVQTSRLEPDKKMSMESYFYTYPITDGLSSKFYDHPSFLENKLLPYQQPTYYPQPLLHMPLLQGRVLFAAGDMTGKKIKDSLQVLLKGNGRWAFLPVVKDSFFYPTAQDLLIKEDTSLFSMASPVVKKRNEQNIAYAVQVDDPMTQPVQNLIPLFPAVEATSVQSNTTGKLHDTALGNMLATVTVKSREDALVSDAPYTSNNCGDYVCKDNILNCPVHPPGTPGNHPPIKGREYTILINPYIYTGRELSDEFYTIVYTGCAVNKVIGIYTSREFRDMDSSKLSNSATKTYLSTLYWQPFLLAAEGKDTQLSFYTSDLTGSFKIILEGINGKGEVFYKEQSFVIENR